MVVLIQDPPHKGGVKLKLPYMLTLGFAKAKFRALVTCACTNVFLSWGLYAYVVRVLVKY